jgi:hypothetical protein
MASKKDADKLAAKEKAKRSKNFGARTADSLMGKAFAAGSGRSSAKRK